MKHILISDTTLCRVGSTFSFKEKIEIARQLDRLNVDAIELPEISNVRTDVLLVRTISSFVKSSILSVAAGITMDSVVNAAAALSAAAHPRIRIELPMSREEEVFGFGLQLKNTRHRGQSRSMRVNADPVGPNGESHAPVPFFVSTKGKGLK